MFGTLPDFTPRDSHSLWYTSSRTPLALPDAPSDQPNPNQHHQSSRHRSQALIERSPLHQLALDERYHARRRLNVANFGTTWMKPPGVPKTLHQLREEKREQEEHAEAMRREALQQELAAAEGTEGPEGEMDDVQLDGAADLDDEVPEAGEDFMMDEDDEDVSEEEASDQSSEQGEEEYPPLDEEALREERQNDLIAARMRMTDDAYREALIRGDPDGDDMYGGQEEVQEDLEGHMLDEEDLVGVDADDDADLGMDADLDDDIPEAEHSFGGYEHTDSGAELSSSENEPPSDDAAEEEQQEGEEEDVEVEEDDSDDFAPRTVRMAEPQSPTMRGLSTLGASRLSIDISGILSQDESSFMDSSPAQARRARYG